MAEGYKLWTDCKMCKAGQKEVWIPPTLTVPGHFENAACSLCGGSGFIFFGWCSADLFTMPAGLPNPEE